MAPKLEHVFTMRGYMSKEDTANVNTVKSGPLRIIVPLTHGFIRGSGVDATLLPGGSDWILLDPSTNVAHIDVRTQARTADGHSLFVHYTGILKIDEATQKALNWSPEAKTTNYGDHEWFTGPIIETSDPKFKWVENSLFIARGHWVVEDGAKAEAVEYEIYKVVN